MPLRLDAAFLADVHLDGLSQPEANLMLSHVYETLEARVGMRLAIAMKPYQLDEFELLVEQEDDEAAFTWLRDNFPNYVTMVEEELELLRTEIRQMAPAILQLGGRGE